MNLVIRAVSLAGAPLSQSITGYFDARGGTIGRSDSNTLALPDPERHISRLQAEVQHGPSGYVIRNVSTTNAFILNDQRIVPGQAHALGHGDELQIGTYVLKVEQVRDNDTVRTITLGRVAADANAVIAASAGDERTDPRPAVPLAAAAASARAAPAVASMPRSTPQTNPMAAAAPKAPEDPFGLGAAPLSTNNPFADLFGGPSPVGVGVGGQGASVPPAPSGPDDLFAALLDPAASSTPAPFALPPASGRVAPPAAALAPAPSPIAAAARLPDDFDPFADLKPSEQPSNDPFASFGSAMNPPPPAASQTGADAGIADLLGSVGAPSATPSLNTMFGLNPQPAAGQDPLADFLAPAAPVAGGSAAARQALSLDPLELLGNPPAAGVPTSPPTPLPPPAPLAALAAARDHTPALQGEFKPPHLERFSTETMPAARVHKQAQGSSLPPPGAAPSNATVVKASPPEPPPAKPAPPALVEAVANRHTAGPVATQEELWAAFCDGTGAPFNPPQGLNPELMRMIGQLLRQAVEGTRQLMAARATIKQELRANVTIIQPRNNNPLKFAPDAQAALEQLLQPPLRGFMAGPRAIDDAMNDLLGHAIGTMAGMRAALDGVLDRFTPERLEAKLVGRSVIDNLVPMNRRAKLWELYLQHFQGVSSEAREDFHTLFGKAFLQAYEEQLDRLDAQQRAQH